MADRGYDGLSEKQQRMRKQVLDGIRRSGGSAEMHLLTAEGSDEDRAAVAESLAEGAGAGYR